MAKIKSFQGLLYNRRKVEIDKVVSPPYDIISSQKRDYLYNSSPYNVVRLILNRSEEPYREARRLMATWIKERTLIRDFRKSLYFYSQRFNYREREYRRVGFISLLKLESLGSKILAHERTYERPKKDRFNLLIEVKANLSPIFVIFSDKKGQISDIFKKVERRQVYFNFDFEKVNHQLWKISNSNIINEVKKIMEEKPIFIADGHHRYEVALNYKNIMRKKYRSEKEMPYDYIMSYFAPIEQEGLLILPTHRVVNLKYKREIFINKLRHFFEIWEYSSREELFKKLLLQRIYSFGVYFKNKFYLLKIKSEMRNKIQAQDESLLNLDVSILDILILKQLFNYQGDIYYTRDETEAINLINQGLYDSAFFLNPIPVEKIVYLAKRNLLLPQKSTYFYPKILTGLVFYKF